MTSLPRNQKAKRIMQKEAESPNRETAALKKDQRELGANLLILGIILISNQIVFMFTGEMPSLGIGVYLPLGFIGVILYRRYKRP